ncbi:MAG: ABC transporter ATP-binding protein [Pseudomonadota bacterium]
MINVNDLRFSWSKNTAPVLNIDQFAVERGEHVFLQGPSGSGKTTLLSLLGGVVPPTSGSIHINDIEVSSLPGAKRDQFRVDEIGFIFQMFNLIPYLSPVQNVLLPCRFSPKRRQQASQHHSLTDEAKRLLTQLGLEAELNRKTSSALSVGQQQRVAAARALIGSPAVVIADEPTSALDADARVNFLQLLFEECNRTDATVLFVSHDAALAHQFARTVNLKEINQAGDAR